RGAVAEEDSPLNPPALVSWRPAVERRVLEAGQFGLRAGVIRPGLVYGRGGGVLGWLLRSARGTGGVRCVGTGPTRWALVHATDLANLYLRVLVCAPAGTLLNAVADPPIRLGELALAISRQAGCPGQVVAWPVEEARETLGPRADAFALDQQVVARRAAE